MKRTESREQRAEEELLFLLELARQIAPSLVAFLLLYLLFRWGG